MQAWYAGPTQKNIDKVIETGPKLKDLFEDGDFFPELKAYNPKLLEYLSNTPALIGEAIEYLTVAPREEDALVRKYKYPLMAAEMVETETVSVLSSFFKPVTSEAASGTAANSNPSAANGSPVYLDLLFGLLDQPQPLPLLTGYFLRVCNTLLNVRYK